MQPAEGTCRGRKYRCARDASTDVVGGRCSRTHLHWDSRAVFGSGTPSVFLLGSGSGISKAACGAGPRGESPHTHPSAGDRSSMGPRLGLLEHLSLALLDSYCPTLLPSAWGLRKGPTTVPRRVNAGQQGSALLQMPDASAHPMHAHVGGNVSASISPTRRTPPRIAGEASHGDEPHSAPLSSSGPWGSSKPERSQLSTRRPQPGGT